ncbi:MAG TPA: hypothetical protein PK876_10965 [Elusimicrobiota bacterium]|nr:hypothetical protein [Elusimicrobiota bacterium]
MTVCFVVPPFQDTRLPSAELAQMVGVTRQYGYSVEVHDINIRLWDRFKDDRLRDLWQSEIRLFWIDPLRVSNFWDRHMAPLQLEKDILKSGPTVVCFWLTASSLYFGVLMARRIKEVSPDVKVIFANPHLLIGAMKDEWNWRLSNFLEKNPVDMVLQGTAHHTLSFILRDIENPNILDPGIGIHCKKKGRVQLGTSPAPLGTLDSLSFADFTAFPMGLYEDQKSIPFRIAQGCECPFCLDNAMGPDHVVMSGRRLYFEALYHRRCFPKRTHLIVQGPIGQKGLTALADFSKMVVKNNEENERLSLTWEAHLAYPVGLPDDLARLMAQSGCQCVNYDVAPTALSVDGFLKKGKNPMRTSARIILGPTGSSDRNIRDLVSVDSKKKGEDFDEAQIVLTDPARLDIFYLTQFLDYQGLRTYTDSRNRDSDVEMEMYLKFAKLWEKKDIKTLDPARMDAILKTWEAQSLLIHENRPVDALRLYFQVMDVAGFREIISLYLESFSKDIQRLHSIGSRLYEADDILQRQEPGSRKKIWENSPTFSDPADHGTCYRHRRSMGIFKDLQIQRAERLWLSAISRAAQVKMLWSRIDYVEMEDRLYVRWGHNRLSLDDLFKLCDDYYDRFPALSEWWHRWRIRFWVSWSRPLSAIEESLKLRGKTGVSVMPYPPRDMKRLSRMAGLFEGIVRSSDGMDRTQRSELWRRLEQLPAKKKRQDLVSYRNKMKVVPGDLLQRVERMWLVSMWQALRLEGSRLRLGYAPDSDSFQLFWGQDSLPVPVLREKLDSLEGRGAGRGRTGFLSALFGRWFCRKAEAAPAGGCR